MTIRRKRGEPTDAVAADDDAASVTPELIAGHTVVRKAAVGRVSEVYLARSPAGFLVAVKVAPKSAAREVERELDVAAAAPDCQHLLVVKDVSRRGNVDALVFAWMRPLNEVIGSRTLVYGEAVTLAVSLIRALAELHSAGFAHARVTPGRIFVDSSGRPHLAGFGCSLVLDRLHAEDRGEAIHDDFQAARAVIAEWLPLPERVSRLFDGPWRGRNDYVANIEKLEEALFEIAAPLPLGKAAGVEAPPARAVTRRGMTVVQPGVTSTAGEGTVNTKPRGRYRTEVPKTPRLSIANLTRAVRQRTKSWFDLYRRRVWWAAIVAGVTAAIALAALPPDFAQSRKVAAARGAEAPVAVQTTGQDDRAVRALKAGAQAASDPAPATDHVPATDPVPEDPIAAALFLLQQRAKCFELAELGCLDSIDQRDSPLLDADRSKVASARAEGGRAQAAAPQDAHELSIIDRTGGSVLVSWVGKNKPASLLMVRGEAGWRLREIFEPSTN